MGCSSCCAVPAEEEPKPKPPDKSSSDESLELSQKEVDEMMGELQLFLSFLQKKHLKKKQ